MRCGRTLLAATVLVTAWASSAAAAERIQRFHSDIEILADGVLHVTETITVTAEGNQIKRGIYRDFPCVYRTKYRVPIELPFSVVSVQRDGRPELFHTEKSANGIRVYVGREDVQLPPGTYTYELRYTTNFQLGFFDTYDELYWNVTGNDWNFAIDQATAAVRLPSAVPPGQLRHEGFTGPAGSKARDLTSQVNDQTGAVEQIGAVEFATTKPLGVREGLTIVVGFPKGVVRKPTAAERSLVYFRANLVLQVVAGGLLVVLLYYFFAWLAVGRDPSRGVIVPLAEPPLDLPPACMRYVRRMGYDRKCFAAAVLNLAVNKQLKITEQGGEFTLHRTEPRTKVRLAASERSLLDTLLNWKSLRGQSLRLEPGQHATVRKAIEQLGQRLAREYDGKLFVRNRRWLVPGWMLSAVALLAAALTSGWGSLATVAFLSVWLSLWTVGCTVLALNVLAAWRSVLGLRRKTQGQLGTTLGTVFFTAFATPFFVAEVVVFGVLVQEASIWMLPLLVGLVLINWAFWHWIKQPTMEGRRVMDEIEGFRGYLAAAQSDYGPGLASAGGGTELFEKYLPYAIALDVETEWSGQFTDALRCAAAPDSTGDDRGYCPVWYDSDNWNPTAATAFAAGIGSSLGAAIASSSTAPGSASGFSGGGSGGDGGGGGGGGDGGGCSGGGGGGGGGGGW